MNNWPLARRKLIQRLRKFGVLEESKRGTGHRALCKDMVPGKRLAYTLPFHGNNETVQPSVIKAIRERFLLTPENSVSDGEFYG